MGDTNVPFGKEAFTYDKVGQVQIARRLSVLFNFANDDKLPKATKLK